MAEVDIIGAEYIYGLHDIINKKLVTNDMINFAIDLQF